jgi:alpha-tubulin suppressor-like RCC1 family protein
VGGIQAIEVAASGIGTGSGSHSCAISKDRLTVWCWGRNDAGQLGNGNITLGATANATPTIVVGQKPN